MRIMGFHKNENVKAVFAQQIGRNMADVGRGGCRAQGRPKTEQYFYEMQAIKNNFFIL